MQYTADRLSPLRQLLLQCSIVRYEIFICKTFWVNLNQQFTCKQYRVKYAILPQLFSTCQKRSLIFPPMQDLAQIARLLEFEWFGSFLSTSSHCSKSIVGGFNTSSLTACEYCHS